MYESGSGCDIDPINAYTWYLIYSETKFSGDTKEELERVALSLTSIEIEQAQRNMQTVFD
jgi:hypothetical protein